MNLVLDDNLILTNSGWRYIEEIDLNTKIATYYKSPTKILNCVAFEKPKSIDIKLYSGKTAIFANKSFLKEVEIPINTKILVYNDDVDLIEKKAIKLKSFKFISANKKDYGIYNSYNTKDEFAIAVITRGNLIHTNANSKHKRNRYEFIFNKNEKQKSNRLIRLAKILNYDLQIKNKKNKTIINVWTNKFYPKYLHQLNNGRFDLDEYTSDYLSFILDDLIYWTDGYILKNENPNTELNNDLNLISSIITLTNNINDRIFYQGKLQLHSCPYSERFEKINYNSATQKAFSIKVASKYYFVKNPYGIVYVVKS